MTSQFREGGVTGSDILQQPRSYFEQYWRKMKNDERDFKLQNVNNKSSIERRQVSGYQPLEVAFPLESGLPQPEVFLTESSDATLSINDASTSEPIPIASPTDYSFSPRRQVLTLQEEQVSSLPLQRFAFSTDKQFSDATSMSEPMSQENQSQSLFSSEEGIQFLSLGKQQCENEEMVDPSQYNDFFNRIFHHQMQEQDRLEPPLGPLTPLEECERKLEECEIGTHKEEILFTLDQMREIRRGVDFLRVTGDEHSLPEVQELSDSVEEYQDAFDTLVDLVKTGNCNCEECTGEEPITLYVECESEDSSNSEDDDDDDEESPQREKEVVMSVGTKVEVGVLPGGVKKKKGGRRSKRPKGRKRTGKRKGKRRIPLGMPQSKLLLTKELYYGNITDVASVNASSFLPLTGLGAVSALGGIVIDNTVGLNLFTSSYDQYRVLEVHVQVALNNNEANTNIMYGTLTNQIPVNNAAANFQTAQGRHSRTKFVTEHNTLSAAWFRFSFRIKCASIYGDSKQYLADENTAGSCNALTGPPPVPTAPANNIYLIVGGMLPKAGAVFTAAGMNYEISVTKIVKFFEVRTQTG